ncbi:MAG: molybdenum cofactor biosynthesis protein MoaE [Burkholderiaceae bacterium]|nr:molybdenum cofactor biosynthesis protein MoaE [Burkholderiaceae bacterium]
MKISVQYEDFDVDKELKALRSSTKVGALVTFIGTVRDINDSENVKSMTLEYYPGMTEKSIEKIVKTACERWNIEDVTVIHRVGKLQVTDQIVLIGVSCLHRKEAFDACEYIIDFLKTEAPFWKQEELERGKRWVEAHMEDEMCRNNW